MKYILPILLLAVGALAAYLFFARKKEEEPPADTNPYLYGKPSAAYDVPGPRLSDLTVPPYVGVINCIKEPCVLI